MLCGSKINAQRVPAGGGNQPGFLSLLVAMPDRGQGVVIMTNGQNGHELATEVVFSVIDEYGWPESDDRSHRVSGGGS